MRMNGRLLGSGFGRAVGSDRCDMTSKQDTVRTRGERDVRSWVELQASEYGSWDVSHSCFAVFSSTLFPLPLNRPLGPYAPGALVWILSFVPAAAKQQIAMTENERERKIYFCPPSPSAGLR